MHCAVPHRVDGLFCGRRPTLRPKGSNRRRFPCTPCTPCTPETSARRPWCQAAARCSGPANVSSSLHKGESLMSRTPKLALAALGFALLVPAAVSAQDTATIAGSVEDSTGGVLPGVTVVASSPVLIEGSRTVVTDGAGARMVVSMDRHPTNGYSPKQEARLSPASWDTTRKKWYARQGSNLRPSA